MIFAKIVNYLKESKIELKKVIWPTYSETFNYTLAVVGICLAAAIFLGALDYFFNFILKTLIIK
ncbi:MAG: preprotein translocase subunit SecE [candidate division WOR-3 bacterium]